jgi:SAM-dependent methyltransferase
MDNVAVPDHELLERALGRPWYHRIELRPGVWTDGQVFVAELAPRLLPTDLAGLRALDVGTFDGAWAFQLEARGAAEVIALDVPDFSDAEWPPRNRRRLAAEAAGQLPRERFELAHEILGSRVRHVEARIYDLQPAVTGGAVDYAVLSDLLLHLRDPVAGLAAVRRVLKPGGRLLVSEQVNLWLTLTNPRRSAASLQTGWTDYCWWEPNAFALREWLHQAGFAPPHRVRRFRLPAVRPQARFHMALEQRPDPGFDGD